MISLLLTLQLLLFPPKPLITLTFDDGPTKYTPNTLKILQKEGISAIFCPIGARVHFHPKWAKMVRKMANSGHLLCNHTFYHREFPKLTHRQQKWAISRAEKVILKIVGYKPWYFRFPSGMETPFARRFLKKRGISVLRWDIAWDLRRSGPSLLAKRVIRSVVRSKKSKIAILFHEHLLRTQRALPVIITKLKKMGYRFGI